VVYTVTVILLAIEVAMAADRDDRAAHVAVHYRESEQVHHFLSSADALWKGARLAKKWWGTVI
jgi:hypothetical protein